MNIWRTAEDDTTWPDAAAGLLANGGVVALPTDTYYGLAADPRSAQGIHRVLELKGRAEEHPLLLLAADAEGARRLAASTDVRFDVLAAEFWPGPLTLVVPARKSLHHALVGPTGGVAVRVPDAPEPRRLARALGAPVTGTSANVTGAAPVRSAEEIALNGPGLGGVVDGGGTPGGPPSTLVDLTTEPARLLRDGAVGAAILRESLGGRLV